MITFDEADKIEITSEEISAFKRLLGNNDFQTFQDFVEKQIMKKAYALATGSFVEGITKEDYLNELRGFARNWKRIKSSVNFKENESETNK